MKITMSQWVLWLGEGLLFGFIGAAINHFLLIRALRRMDLEPERGERVLAICYFKRYIVNIITLLIAYFIIFPNTFFLIGTAFGLTIMKFIYTYKGLTNQQMNIK